LLASLHASRRGHATQWLSAGAAACGAVALGPHTGQQRGQNIPRTNTGWCIFSARPPQFEQAAFTIPD
jgi:hypothetical protein